MLAELERHAAEHGASIIRLETNKTLVEAISMYRSAGYREVEAFNDESYADHWFEKRLTPEGRAQTGGPEAACLIPRGVVDLVDVEVAHLGVLGRLRRYGIERRSSEELDLDVVRVAAEGEEPP